MARYGQDMGRDRWSGGGGYGQGGYGGGQYGGGMSRNRYGGEYGGMGSDAGYGGGSQAYGGHSGFGSGGGAYDNDYGSGSYGGYGYGGGQGYRGSSRGQGPYGADSGFNYGGTEGLGGGYGYGGGSTGGYGGTPGGQGGAGYTGGGYGAAGQSYGGYGGGWTGGGLSDTGRAYGGSGFGGSTQGDELRRMRAADVMTDNPECVTPETSLSDAARKMRDLDVGIIPVVESDTSRRLRGVLTDRDIAIRAVAEGKDAHTTRVMEVMTTQVETCNKNDSLRDVLGVMEREQVRRVPITDREGRLVGIIAQADVATEVDSPAGQRRFAETVGDISEPGNPRGRGGWSAGRMSQGRGGGTGSGLMGAVRNAVSHLGGGRQGGEPSRMGGPGMAGGTGMSGGRAQGNTDPRAIADPGSENV